MYREGILRVVVIDRSVIAIAPASPSSLPPAFLFTKK
jgi:hypothetical protein